LVTTLVVSLAAADVVVVGFVVFLALAVAVVAATGVSFFFAEAEASFASFFGAILKGGDLKSIIKKLNYHLASEIRRYLILFCTQNEEKIISVVYRSLSVGFLLVRILVKFYIKILISS
jgi:hypothetical protein